jgi:tetratricopeptide (TPR) repeat protein
MNPRKSLLAFLIVAMLCGSGCGGDPLSASSETEDSTYRDAQQFEREGRSDEALAAYLKVIVRRGDAAPESHLDAGILYLHHIHDPIAAIYHFRKYLELEPNSKLAANVREQIDEAKREFARTLPGQPMENQTERLAMVDQVDRLQRENDELKSEIAALRSGSGPSAPVRSTTIELGAQPAPAPVPVAPAPVQGSEESAIREAPEPQAPAAQERTHTVAKGDTLFSLALKYYGNRSKWRAILEANKDVLPDEKSPLRIGMVLKIP